MRINIVLDEKLVKEAMKFSDKKTKKELIHDALVLFIEIRSRKDIRDLKGKISFSENYDHKKLRAG